MKSILAYSRPVEFDKKCLGGVSALPHGGVENENNQPKHIVSSPFLEGLSG
jgi:hypothetical protein